MRNWLAVFALALLVLVGFASGPFGTVSFLLTFLTARYLFAARELGFERAWTKLGIALSPPLWQRSNLQWVPSIFDDEERFWKACSVASGLTAMSLMLSPISVGVVAVVIATCYIIDIARLNAPAARAPESADRGARTLPAAPMPRVVRVIAASPAESHKPAKKSAPAPKQPAPAKATPAAPASVGSVATATPKLSAVPVPDPPPPSPPAKAEAKTPATAMASTAAKVPRDRQLDEASSRPQPPKQPTQQLPLRQQQQRQSAQQKPQRKRPLRKQQPQNPRRKRPQAQQQAQLPSRRPEQPSKNRPLRKSLQRRPPLRAGRPARQQPRLVTHRPGKKLRRRKPDQ